MIVNGQNKASKAIYQVTYNYIPSLICEKNDHTDTPIIATMDTIAHIAKIHNANSVLQKQSIDCAISG